MLSTKPSVLAPVEPGDLVVMIGASGSGKSTLLRDLPPTQVVSLRAVVADSFSVKFSVLD
ncbi:hypothetical protein GCM10010495_44710 [Kitasatospora herbaricolor]|uniref:hypothetical protein n=1 Tax=Kitasatospora herbaricolor TaxID=68217 RepID=UPI00174DE041|nr:hypothetical protein [Kitasatospora herbaricolor]MDQ0305984.1 ABC-type lipoprotein export system ATPase subunit [Kitasatospora herbaricolor]GGV24068.1 hypothetical protein GCM10010495_44710 [Kitasatospora herbaricolor]